MTILFVLAYYLLLSPTTLSTSIDFIPPLASRFDSSLVAVENCNRRSIWNIVWSCVTTIFACTWVAIHPNIPGLRDSKWKILRRRLKLMLRVIFLPESVVYWAWRQYYGAKEVADRYNNENLQKRMNTVPAISATTFPLVGVNMIDEPERWTRTHGFFAIMGGFALYRSDDKPIRTLTPNDLFEYAAAGAIEWPKIREEEIWDRSKGDYLSKGIVVLQTFWFITTCLARAIQQLPITELEIVTLAFATFNGLIYFFWLHKPLDVRCPIHVRLNPSYYGPLLDVVDDAIAQEVPWIARPSIDIKMRLRNVLSTIPAVPTRVWIAISRSITEHGFITFLLHTLTKWMVSVVGDDYLVEGTSGREATRIKTFFAPVSLNKIESIYFASLAVLGLVFGGIHLAAWSFQFPTDVEKWIWRGASLTLLGSPISLIVWLLISSLIESLFEKICLDTHIPPVSDFQESFHSLMVCITVVVYVVARILLLVLPLIAFRSLPPGALADVAWTSFVPHIG